MKKAEMSPNPITAMSLIKNQTSFEKSSAMCSNFTTQKGVQMKNTVIFTLALLGSVCFAQTKPAAKSAKAAVATEAKKDVIGTLKWTGYGVGKSHEGTIGVKSGHVEMKGSDLTGGNIVLDMTTLKTGDSPKLEGHLKNADFFDVEKFNEGNFKITKVEALKSPAAGAPTHKITGNLTIKGKTQPQEVLATITKQGEKFIAVGEAEIKDRTQYDIVYRSGRFEAASVLGNKLIQDNIKIQFDLQTL
jgi:polyisoprenoid-binding protein YceI